MDGAWFVHFAKPGLASNCWRCAGPINLSLRARAVLRAPLLRYLRKVT